MLLAVQVARAGVRAFRQPTGADPRTPPACAARAYLRLVALTVANPLTFVYFTALVVGRSPGSAVSPAAQLAFVIAATLASAGWQLLLVGGGAVLGRTLTGRRGRLGTALASSALIVALAFRSALA